RARPRLQGARAGQSIPRGCELLSRYRRGESNADDRGQCASRSRPHQRAADMSVSHILAIIVRYGLVMLFLPFSALDKTIGFEGAVKQSQELFKVRGAAIFVLMC